MRFIVFAAILLTGVAHAQQPTKPDPHCQMMQHGDEAMGFRATKTSHHFRLSENGGAIEVAANDPNDTKSRDEIRMHLSHVASMFANGDFAVPMFIHETNPPGAPTMTKLRGQIHYECQDTPTGGRVQILTQNDQALDAVHAFLLFQIIEHRTGDSAAISSH